jgi:hypothetical protein
MSFLTRTVVPRFSAQLRVAGARAFSTTLVTRKIVPDAVKEPVKKIDRAVSDKLVDGIELGRKHSIPLSPSPFLKRSESAPIQTWLGGETTFFPFPCVGFWSVAGL